MFQGSEATAVEGKRIGSGRLEEGADSAGWGVDDRPTLLLAAFRPGDEIGAMAQGAGFRMAGSIALDALAERLALTVGVDALVLDLRGLDGDDPALSQALAVLVGWPGWSDARPLFLVDLAAAEAVLALTQTGFDRLLCEPGLGEIGAALCLLARGGGRGACLRDIGRESDAARLEQLSEEVRRLAQTIDRLAREDKSETPTGLKDRDQPYAAPPATIEEVRSASGAEVRAVLHARRLRERFLPADLFADPAWDMMLDLWSAGIDGKRVSVSSLCIASAVPPTTALRWISQLTDRGLFERRNDPDDARRVFISLSPEATDKMKGWFSAVRRSGIRFSA